MLPKNPEEFHQKLALVFHALLALPITFFIYLFLELKHKGLAPSLNSELLLDFATYGLPVLGVLLALTAHFRFRKYLELMSKEKSLPERLKEYGKKLSVYYYYVAASSVVWVLGLYLTTSSIFIIGYVLLLFFLSFQRPTPEKYVKDLALEGEDKKIILHKKEFENAE